MKFLLLFIALTFTISAEDTRSKDALPNGTLGYIQLDLSSELFRSLQENTKLGKHILSVDRFNGVLATIKKHAEVNPKLAAIRAELKSSGFSIDELAKVFNSKLLLSLSLDQVKGHKVWTILGSAKLKGDLAKRIVTDLINREVGESLKLSGKSALYFHEGHKSGHSILSVVDDTLFISISDIDDKSKPGYFELVKEGKHEDAAQKVSDICRQNLLKYTSNFTSRQKSTYTKNLSANRFLESNNVPGQLVTEAHVDLKSLLALEENDKAKLSLLGLNNLLSFKTQLSFSENNFYITSLLESPEPRKGLLAFLNQPSIDVMPPKWVPADVNSYSHISLNVKKVAEDISRLASQQLGQAAVDHQIKDMDTKCQAFLGSTFENLLSAFGDRAIILDYGVDFVKSSGHMKPMPSTAVILQFNDPNVLNRVIEIITPFAANKGIKRNDMNGFKGFSLNIPNFKGSLYMGHDLIVLTTGLGVAKSLLPNIENPSLTKTLRSDPKFQSYIKKQNVSKGIFFSYGNANKALLTSYDLISQSVNLDMMLQSSDKRDKAFLKDLLKYLPTKNELDGVLGISSAYAYPQQSGIILKGKINLPK
ncbi:MAG: hypothetical protein NE330_06820 [Lentisphaeraceae bacterium]|nr:hypothetical protein [Lentisphaeraceae bacterium]